MRPEHLEFDLTSRCNAACPHCPRSNPIFAPHLDTDEEITLSDIQSWFPKEVLTDLKKVTFEGTFSDPLMSNHLIGIVQHFLDSSSANIRIYTNASLRSESWWQRLGSLSDRITVIFAIDGLSDTHSIYRVNTSFNKIISNAKSYIAAGGNAAWKFLAFLHNDHQVDQAREMSEELGFKEFILEPGARFQSGDDYVINKKGQTIQQTALPLFSKPIATSDQASCKSKNTSWIVIHWNGDVLPCCYVPWQSGLFDNIKTVQPLRKSATGDVDSSYALSKVGHADRLFWRKITKGNSNLRRNSLENILGLIEDFYAALNVRYTPACCKSKCPKSTQ